MVLPEFILSEEHTSSNLEKKLWIYTNYDCNLRCSYCAAESSPSTPSRALGLQAVLQLVDEALASGCEHFYFTGGEPFLLDEIYAMLSYASERAMTTVLTNAMLLRGKRLEKLIAIRNDHLIIQVSLDGSRPEQHDPFRGLGSWQKTVEGIQNLQAHGFQIHLATTETPANTAHLEEICAFHLAMGIPEQAHFVRPLARRGFSEAGQEVCKENLIPEITVNADGVFWHPLSTDPDMRISESIFPLQDAVGLAQQGLLAITRNKKAALSSFE